MSSSGTGTSSSESDKKKTSKAKCIAEVGNWSKVKPVYMFDKQTAFIPEVVAARTPEASPKIAALLERIKECDEADMREEGKLFKHMIFSGNPNTTYGAKIVTSALLASGYNLVFNASAEGNLKHKPMDELVGNKAENVKTMTMLASKPVYGKPMTTYFKKHTLELFNKRPDNIHGDMIRFIILDGGFREGIDLFDIKYIHLLEPTPIAADEKQAIGRGTRFCGQKGLKFHPTKGWPLHVYKYEVGIPTQMRSHLQDTDRFLDLQMKYSNIDLRLVTFASELEEVSIGAAVDKALTQPIHSFKIGGGYDYDGMGGSAEVEVDEGTNGLVEQDLAVANNPVAHFNGMSDVAEMAPASCMQEQSDLPATAESAGLHAGGGKRKRESRQSSDSPPARVYYLRNKSLGSTGTKVPTEIMPYSRMQTFVRKYFGKFEYPIAKLENGCMSGGAIAATFSPTQDFIRHFFQPASAYKGMLLHHSVGSGKTCTGVSLASTSWEKEGYTILWVTRHTLKADVSKNIHGSIVCSIPMQERLKEGKTISKKYLSDNWMKVISYKQFSNMLLKKNQIYDEIVKRNGTEDPLKKTLIIIDEAHKLYAPNAPAAEKPQMEIMEDMLQNSYSKSGKDSARLVLMTATPYTDSPMEMIKLLNLLRPSRDSLPVDFDDFTHEYLTPAGTFTRRGKRKFRDDVSGYISYLNRSADARNFAYPVIHDVTVPMSLTITRDPDTKFNRYTKNIKELKKEYREAKRATNAKPIIEACIERATEAFNNEKDTVANVKDMAKQAKTEGNAACMGEPKAQRPACKERVKGEYDATMNRAAEQLAAARARFAQDKKECKDLGKAGVEQAAEEVRTRLEQMEAEYQEIRKEKNDLRFEVNRLKREFAVAKEAYLHRKAAKAHDLDELKKQKKDLSEAEIKRRRKAIMEKYSNISTLSTRINEIRQTIQNINIKIQLLTEKIGTRYPDDMSQQSALRTRCGFKLPDPNAKKKKSPPRRASPRFRPPTPPRPRQNANARPASSPYEGPSANEFRQAFYEAYGINGETEAKKVYRRFTLQYHPDKHPGEEKKYEKIFKVLSGTWTNFKQAHSIAGGAEESVWV